MNEERKTLERKIELKEQFITLLIREFLTLKLELAEMEELCAVKDAAV